MDLLYTADNPTAWDGAVGDRIRAELDRGRIVVTRTVSGAGMVLATVVDSNGGAQTTGIRQGLTWIAGRPTASR